jgi:outer membrane protein OmpA-like peptidoglycan-associated protein
VKPVSAESLRAALDGRGRVALFLPFVFDRGTPRADAGPMVAEIVKLLGEVRDLRLLIENHSDNVGPRERNLALATARAEAVRDAILAGGVDPARVKAVGIGPDRPVTDNATSEARARNRRTVLVRQ